MGSWWLQWVRIIIRIIMDEWAGIDIKYINIRWGRTAHQKGILHWL